MGFLEVSEGLGLWALNEALTSDEDSSSSAYNPANYTQTVDVPEVNTDTVVAKEDAAKEAETPDTAAFDAAEENRRKKNGVKGTFTNGGAAEVASADGTGGVAKLGD